MRKEFWIPVKTDLGKFVLDLYGLFEYLEISRKHLDESLNVLFFILHNFPNIRFNQYVKYSAIIKMYPSNAALDFNISIFYYSRDKCMSEIRISSNFEEIGVRTFRTSPKVTNYNYGINSQVNRLLKNIGFIDSYSNMDTPIHTFRAFRSIKQIGISIEDIKHIKSNIRSKDILPKWEYCVQEGDE